uniref:DNA polymerase nu (inferred by orthology to a human protein) n=1 Tax=Anisakis simplex TaxID=6269 RepID=A0A0M3IZB1_ANISI
LNKWLSGEKAMTDLESATLLAARARQYLTSSIRNLGVFSETQLSLLLSSSSDTSYTVQDNDSSQFNSQSIQQPTESPSVENEMNRSQQEINLDEKCLLELSSRDLFDGSSIYGEECFDERSLYGSNVENTTTSAVLDCVRDEDNGKDGLPSGNNDDSDEILDIKIRASQIEKRPIETDDKATLVEDEKILDKITKKMSRTSISSYVKREPLTESMLKNEQIIGSVPKCSPTLSASSKILHTGMVFADSGNLADDKHQTERTESKKFAVPKRATKCVDENKSSPIIAENEQSKITKNAQSDIVETKDDLKQRLSVRKNLEANNRVASQAIEKHRPSPEPSRYQSGSEFGCSLDDSAFSALIFTAEQSAIPPSPSSLPTQKMAAPLQSPKNDCSLSDSIFLDMLIESENEPKGAALQSQSQSKSQPQLPEPQNNQFESVRDLTVPLLSANGNEKVTESSTSSAAISTRSSSSVHPVLNNCSAISNIIVAAAEQNTSRIDAMKISKGVPCNGAKISDVSDGVSNEIEAESHKGQGSDVAEVSIPRPREVPIYNNEWQKDSFNESDDIFETSQHSQFTSQQISSNQPYEAKHIKRTRQQCYVSDSPTAVSPSCQSPMNKLIKFSSPLSTSSPINNTSSNIHNSHITSNNTVINNIDNNSVNQDVEHAVLQSSLTERTTPNKSVAKFSTPTRRPEAVRLEAGLENMKVSEEINRASLNFSIDDVCRSKSRWLKFVEEVSSWNGDVGVGICFSTGDRSCDSRSDIRAVALCPSRGNPAFIPFEGVSVYGNANEESLYPSFTPCDSVSIADRIDLFESVLASANQRKILVDFLHFTRSLKSPPFSKGLIQQKLSNCVCIRTLSFLAYFRSADGESPLHYKDLVARLIPSAIALNIMKRINVVSSERIRISTYALLNVRLFESLYPLSVRLSSQRFITLEMDSLLLLARLEAVGIGFDAQTAENMIRKVKDEMSQLEAEGRRLAGVAFNFDSPSEIANVLFVRMRIPPLIASSSSTKNDLNTNTRTNTSRSSHYSTNKTVLKQLSKQYPICGVILKWRRLNTALLTSLQNLLHEYESHIGSESTGNNKLTNRIHTNFTIFSQTGRVQSVRPNIQNVQKDEIVDSLSVRSLFIAPPGYKLISADYSQLELRVLAALSKDDTLMELFKSGSDVFQMMTDRWNGNKLIGVSVDRQKVKQVSS